MARPLAIILAAATTTEDTIRRRGTIIATETVITVPATTVIEKGTDTTIPLTEDATARSAIPPATGKTVTVAAC